MIPLSEPSFATPDSDSRFASPPFRIIFRRPLILNASICTACIKYKRENINRPLGNVGRYCRARSRLVTFKRNLSFLRSDSVPLCRTAFCEGLRKFRNIVMKNLMIVMYFTVERILNEIEVFLTWWDLVIFVEFCALYVGESWKNSGFRRSGKK